MSSFLSTSELWLLSVSFYNTQDYFNRSISNHRHSLIKLIISIHTNESSCSNATMQHIDDSNIKTKIFKSFYWRFGVVRKCPTDLFNYLDLLRQRLFIMLGLHPEMNFFFFKTIKIINLGSNLITVILDIFFVFMNSHNNFFTTCDF